MKTENTNDKEQGKYIQGRVMGPLLVLVCPCLQENIIVTCQAVSFCVV